MTAVTCLNSVPRLSLDYLNSEFCCKLIACGKKSVQQAKGGKARKGKNREMWGRYLNVEIRIVKALNVLYDQLFQSACIYSIITYLLFDPYDFYYLSFELSNSTIFHNLTVLSVYSWLENTWQSFENCGVLTI